MAASSLRHHVDRSHGIVLSQGMKVDVGGGGPEIYNMLFPRILKSLDCPVKGCPAMANPPGILRGYFIYRHYKLKVDIMQ